MRIALIVTGGLDRSGREHVIPALLSLVERQSQRHDVTAYVLRYHRHQVSYPLLGATVHDLGSPTGLFRQYKAVVRCLRRDGPFDVLHGYWALPSGLVAAAAGRRLGIPSLVTLDSGEFVSLPEIEYGSQRAWRQRAAVQATLQLSARTTVCTDFMRRMAASHGVEAEVLPIGVDAVAFAPGRPPEPPPWRLLHVANLNPVKDQETLLRAFKRVCDRHPAHLDIAGEDTLGGRLHDLSERMGIATRVTFHGHVPSEALIELYQRSHLFVLSSRHEAAGVVLLEAASCGLPIVGTAVGYLADWGPHLATTVPPGDPVALAGAIDTLLTDEARRGRQAEAARQWATAHDAEWTAVRLDSLYRQLARSP